MISSYYRYDKRLRDNLFIYISMFEEFLRAELGNMFELGICPPPNKVRKKIKYENSSTLDKLTLGDLINLSDSYPDVFSIPSKNDNLSAFRVLRNVISHQQFLLFTELEQCTVDEKTSSDLIPNLYNVKQILPVAFRNGFVKSINSCVNKLDLLKKDRIELH